jgi:hypothetical protein
MSNGSLQAVRQGRPLGDKERPSRLIIEAAKDGTRDVHYRGENRKTFAPSELFRFWAQSGQVVSIGNNAMLKTVRG